MISRRSWLLGTLGGVLLGVGLWLSLGAPRITFVNSGLRVDYPRQRAAGAAAGAAGAALLAFAIPRRGPRIAAGLVTVILAGVAGHILVYRLETDGSGVRARGLLGRTEVAWKDITRVESGSDVVVVWGPGETQIRIDTAAFQATQRAMLDRTLARRVRESQTTPAAEPPRIP
jgi:hypothetical protein